jgi:tetratricopeptide (TPR) repeat protein
MTSENEPTAGLEKSFTRTYLPWLVLAGALALYLATLNPWLTMANMDTAARLAGWDFQPPLTMPLWFLVTYPLRWLPVASQPLALNALTALFAALTLALLARSVALLPHDRTKEQRMREGGAFGLLSFRLAWVPPLVAVAACALQGTFWEHATSGTGEMLNLLLLAYIVRCLLEYRLTEKDSWFYRMAFVYGLATTNNWAMIGLLPIAVATVVGLKGPAGFFQARFFFSTLLAGLGGLLLYLLPPILALQYHHESLTFMVALKYNLGQQKQFLLFSALRLPFMLMMISSLLPLSLLAIRWPSAMGDVNPLSNLVGGFMFRVAHLGFFVLCLAWLYTPSFLEAQLENLVPFLSLRYLCALCVGYFAGYLLLVFGTTTAKAWSQPKPAEKLFNYAIVGATCATLLVIPAILWAKYHPRIQATNSPLLKNFAAQLARSLPAQPAMLLSDEPMRLWLLQAYFAQQNTPFPHLPINTANLPYRLYNQHLAARYPEVWKVLPTNREGKNLVEPIHPLFLIGRLLEVSAVRPVYYLHPSFGYYFEYFQPTPQRMALQLHKQGPRDFTMTALTDAEVKDNLDFWKGYAPELDTIAKLAKEKNLEATTLAKFLSRSLNYWGVQLQLNHRLAEAGGAFDRSLKLYPDNIAARINVVYNAQLRKQKPPFVVSEKEIETKMHVLRTWDAILGENGPFDDPNYNFYLSQIMARSGLNRQAGQLLQRVRTAFTNTIEADLELGAVYLQIGSTEKLFDLVKETRSGANPLYRNPTNQLEIQRLEALGYFAASNYTAAEAVLQTAIRQRPRDPLPLAVAANVFLIRRMPTNALAMLDQQLALNPNDLSALLNKSAVLMQMERYQQAVQPLSLLLEKQPDNQAARMNRAIAYLLLNQLDLAKKDYNSLLQANREQFTIYYGLGEIAYRQKDKRAALKYYESYLKYAPKGIQERKDIEARVKQLKAG